MSNLSDIGFPVQNEQDVNQVLMDVLPLVDQVPCPPYGYYYKFEDRSGSQLYLQTNLEQEIIGFNPAFSGLSRRTAGITHLIERDTSDLDGAFHAWAEPVNDAAEISGLFPFVFDAPDFRAYTAPVIGIREINLTAFASGDLKIFKNEREFQESQDREQRAGAEHFVPSGLFAADADDGQDPAVPPQAHARLGARIVDYELRTNGLTNAGFYWFLAEVLGGRIDIVADPKLVGVEPAKGAIVQGSFWLSGKLTDLRSSA